MATTLLKKTIFSNPESVRKTLGIFCNAARNRKDFYPIILLLIYIHPLALAQPQMFWLLRHSVADWNYQYKPGPYPNTPEEIAAAAKKYGLTLEEYKPYPEDMGYGDYPKLPEIGADSKDIHYPWDFPEIKRNFNEPVRC